MNKAKIVATLGPATSDPNVVRRLVGEGMSVARINFSHGDPATHRHSVTTVRDAAEALDRSVAVLGDLCGPKIRVGCMVRGQIVLEEGAETTITTASVEGTPDRFSTSYELLPGDVRPGDPILLADGMLRLEVIEVEGSDVRCVVRVGGVLADRKGMNLPGTALSTPAITDKDRRDLELACELGVDYLALSFVRRADDVREARQLAGGIPVIAKIEKPEAVEDRHEIVRVADGLMVARGDLGVEAGAEKVPLIQKRLIRDASAHGKPVIVATQMLESMLTSPVPTRAEVSDVANAVLDGADALMLSGETAVGRYPVQAVRRMAAVISEIESSELYRLQPEPVRLDEYSFSNAVARSAVKACQDLGLAALVVLSETGHSANLVSAYRPHTPVVALARDGAVLRRCALRWGLQPLPMPGWIDDMDADIGTIEWLLIDHGLASPGDDIAITYGNHDINGPGRTNMLKLWRVRGGGGSV
jgi:pyruvate kinase